MARSSHFGKYGGKYYQKNNTPKKGKEQFRTLWQGGPKGKKEDFTKAVYKTKT